MNPAPYNVNNYGADVSPDTGFTIVENLAYTEATAPKTRRDWCTFYQKGRIAIDLPESSVFNKGDYLKDIGYWNLMFDQLGSEGFQYAADGNGYTSNVINWHTAVAMNANNEFTPGTEYKTLTHGYSSMFTALFEVIVKLAEQKGVIFKYYPNTRLHSILKEDGTIHYSYATREQPSKKAGSRTTDAAWLSMPPAALDMVAQATRYEDHSGLDELNHEKVQLYLESAILQPSYKIGMFFDTAWWSETAASPCNYPPKLTSYEVTLDVLSSLGEQGFPASYLDAMKNDTNILENPFNSAATLIATVEQLVQQRLTIPQENQLLTTSLRYTIGPSVTDMPIRQVVYFGDNALDTAAPKVYGILASYDDESYTAFWQELELGPDAVRELPISQDTQPLAGPRSAPPIMVKMLRQQLAVLHFGPQADYSVIPEPLETCYMDWSLPPFSAGYHAYEAHYNVCDVQQKIRKPSLLIPGEDANIFIVGEAFSNDQAWVEGAYCTAESVLNDFFGITAIIDETNYPFICPQC